MFTGIIEEVGTVVEAGEGTLRIRSPFVLTDSKLGDSIAINGVDLTVAEMDSETFFANLMPAPGWTLLQVATRLVRVGYMHIDIPLAPDKYAGAFMIDRVEEGAVYLAVPEDDLY